MSLIEQKLEEFAMTNRKIVEIFEGEALCFKDIIDLILLGIYSLQ